MSTPLPLTAKDYKSDQEVRWCPGCGDYSILNQVQKVLAETGADPANTVCVSGIGCSSRFPYYMNTYGFHSIHGRAPAIASGVKLANPDLTVWIATGDGDALSIGGNHFVHLLRRNLNVKILLFNNRIYGLTKGQYSPTSERGKLTKTSPYGTIEAPFNPLAVAFAANATFVARSIDADVKHLQNVLKRAAEHKGTAFVEIYQDCNVYNHLAFDYATDRKSRPHNVVYLEHGKPLVFGPESEYGIRLNGLEPEKVELATGVATDDLIIHDEQADSPALAYILSRMHFPEMPEPVGVFRAIAQPTYDDGLMEQVVRAKEKHGDGDLDKLYRAADTWQVG